MAPSLRSRGKADPVVEVQITQDDLRDLVRAINAHGSKKALTKELRTGLRLALKPMVPEARRAVRSQPAKSSHRSTFHTVKSGKTESVRWSSSLRKDMAQAVEVKVDLGMRSSRIGARIRLDGRKSGRGGLVAMYEGARPWRHPVFGTSTWVTQPHRGFLTEVVDRNRPRIVREVEAVMDGVGKKIDGGH